MRVLWKEGGKAKKNDIYLFQHDDDSHDGLFAKRLFLTGCDFLD